MLTFLWPQSVVDWGVSNIYSFSFQCFDAELLEVTWCRKLICMQVPFPSNIFFCWLEPDFGFFHFPSVICRLPFHSELLVFYWRFPLHCPIFGTLWLRLKDIWSRWILCVLCKEQLQYLVFGDSPSGFFEHIWFLCFIQIFSCMKTFVYENLTAQRYGCRSLFLFLVHSAISEYACSMRKFSSLTDSVRRRIKKRWVLWHFWPWFIISISTLRQLCNTSYSFVW